MRKIYCDATNKEIEGGNYKTLDFPIHIINMTEGKIATY